LRLFRRVFELANASAISTDDPTKNTEEGNGRVYCFDNKKVAHHSWMDEHDWHLDL
jgi:hypothetical protein